MDGTNPPQKNPTPQQPNPLKPEGGVAFEAPKPTPETIADTPTPPVSLEEVDRELEKAGVNTDEPAGGKKVAAEPLATKSSAPAPHDEVPSWLADKKATLASQSAPQVTPPPQSAPKAAATPPRMSVSDIIRPLRTYKDDIARAIQRSKVSKADVSVAEQQRKLDRMEEERTQIALKEKIEQDRARLAEIRKQPHRETPQETASQRPKEADIVVPTEEDLEPIFEPQEPRPATAPEAVTVKKSDTYEEGELARQAAQIRGEPFPRKDTPRTPPPRKVAPEADLQSMVRTQEAELTRRQDLARESQPIRIEERQGGSRLMKVVMGSFVFLLLGAGVLGTTLYIYREKVSPLTPLEIDTLVFAEQKQEIPVETVRGNALMGLLANRAEGTTAPLNAITSLVLTIKDEEGETVEISTQEFFDRAETRASSGLVRSFHPKYMLGLHSFEGSEPFLVFKTSFYENAFAGMLAWESTMSRDLAPLFGPALLNETTSTATSSATTSGIFRDRLINNIDTRVLLDLNGEVRLIYSFIDRQTVVVTTNRDSFLEVVNRLNSTRVTR